MEMKAEVEFRPPHPGKHFSECALKKILSKYPRFDGLDASYGEKRITADP
jgi:hypothetical protein